MPGTVLASRSLNLVEGNEPASVCAGLVFLHGLSETPLAPTPSRLTMLLLVGYPAGQYTYTSVGALQRTVRRFSASLSEAVRLNFNAATNEAPARAAEVK